MRCLLLYLLLLSSGAHAQNTAVRITGKVFTTYNYAVNKTQRTQTGISKTGTEYVSDVKVLLIKVSNARNQQQFFENNRQKFCNNDRAIYRTYTPKIAYTDRNGVYEFTGLARKAQYILIFCDKKIQLSAVFTASRSTITYTVKDREIYF